MEKVELMNLKSFINAISGVPKTIKFIKKLDNKILFKLTLLSILTGVVPLISIRLNSSFINSIVSNEEASIVYRLLFFYIIVVVASNVLDQIYSFINNRNQYTLSFKINRLIMEKCSKLSLEDFEDSEMYNRIEKITSESSYRPFQIMTTLLSLINSITLLLLSIVFISSWNIWPGLVLLAIPVFSLYSFLKIGQYEFSMQWNRAKEERQSWYLTYLLTHDFSFKEIKLRGIQNYILDKYKAIREKFIQQDTGLLKKKFILNNIISFLMQIINISIMIYAINLIMQGKMIVGTLVAIMRIIGLVTSNSQTLIQNIYILYNSGLYMDQFFEFIQFHDVKDNLTVSEDKNVLVDAIDSIEMINMKFKYKKGNFALKNINLKIQKNELVAIVGRNGSGKSTLINIICGLYKEDEGSVIFNGINSSFILPQMYNDEISVLFQDYTKYEMTIRENIGFGNINEINNDLKMKALMNSLDMEYLKVDNDYRLDNYLGNWFDKGQQLSGGQWQKVALARTFYSDSSLYILDEPNSTLDPVSEKQIFDEFIKRSKGKIGIFISHRLVAAKNADRIIVMDNGMIIGEGNHDNLLKNCKVYQEMYYSEKYEEIQGGLSYV